MKRFVTNTLFAAIVGVGLAGCASRAPEVVNFEELPNRPTVKSAPQDSTFVARTVAPGGLTFDVPKGYRYYLVDLEADRLITSDVAKRAGKLEVGNEGAEFDGDSIWKGDTQGAGQIGLFIADRPEQVDGRP